MRRALVGLVPLAVVLALAIGIGIGARIATRDVPIATASPSPSIAAATHARTDAPTERPSPPASSATPSVAPSPGSNDAAAMLSVHNELRAGVGAPAVRADARVTAAAQRHAEYLARNNTLGHDEVAGDAGFSGASVRDRLAAQGYADANASEVATSFGSGTDGVRSLWVLPYHRLGLMHPHAVVAGWGHAEVGGRSTTVGVIVYDFASAAPDRVRSPAADQRVPASWDGEEFPDVLPTGAPRPVGYPIVVVYGKAQPAELRSARISDARGVEVAHHIVPQIYERDYVAIVPAAPLERAARYRVRLEVSVAGGDVIEEWEFATEP